MPISRIKPGVRIPPASAYAVMLWVGASVFHDRGYDCIKTSAIEGAHSWSSEHYKGDAVDFRTWHVNSLEEKREIARDIADALGEDFDVVFHEPGGEYVEHIHVEYDPKRPL